MAVNWDVLVSVLTQEGKDIMAIVKPYLPALARSGPQLFNDFVSHLTNGDLDEIDKLMYGKMTPKERENLENLVLSDAYQAALDNVAEREMTKEIGIKIALGILTKLI